jgi:hypothetical protein
MEINTRFWSYLTEFLFEWEMFHTKVVEKSKHNILCSVNFIFENHAVYEIMWENIVGRGGPQVTKWLMRIACWIRAAIDSILRICNTYCFSRTRLSVTLYCGVRHVLVFVEINDTIKVAYFSKFWNWATLGRYHYIVSLSVRACTFHVKCI